MISSLTFEECAEHDSFRRLFAIPKEEAIDIAVQINGNRYSNDYNGFLFQSWKEIASDENKLAQLNELLRPWALYKPQDMWLLLTVTQIRASEAMQNSLNSQLFPLTI